MSSVSLMVPNMLRLFICIIVHESVSFSLLPVRFSWIGFSLVCITGFETLLLKNCVLLGPRLVLWTVWSESLCLLASVALWVLAGDWISFKRVDCSFLCGFLCLSKNLFCDLLCLRWCFEVLLPEPRRRQLQIDVFMHSSFLGKLERGEKGKILRFLKYRKHSQKLVSFLPTSYRKCIIYLQVLCLCTIPES